MYTSFIRTSIFVAGWTFMQLVPAVAQEKRGKLDEYISMAFDQNQGLKEQQFNLDRSMSALKEAKSMYLPTVSMLGSYTKAAGGRTIDVPVGDLVNPIYTALNQITSSNKYPQLSNESILLNPDNFYDVKLRTSLPLINEEIRYNKLIKQQLISSQQASLNVYKRALVKDIKTAYYRYFQALQSEAIFNSAQLLINENIRANESMLRNGLRNGTALLRSKTELEKNKAQLVEAHRNISNARAYFNFLLNRSLLDSIIVEPASDTEVKSDLTVVNTAAGITKREELSQLRILKQVYVLDEKLQKSGFLPKLNTFIDLGSQGTGTTINDKTRYYLWGVNLQWDIFTGGKRKYRAEQSRSNFNATNSQLEEMEQSIKLQLAQSLNNFQAAQAAYKSAFARLSFSSKYYGDQLKAYHAGQLLYLELIDAQDQLTSARLQVADAQADVQIAAAELEREQAAYPIHNHN